MIARLTSHLMRLVPVRTHRSIFRNHRENSGTHATQTGGRQLLVDVSVISKHDARTGIQRTVRALLQALIENPPDGFTICPVAASRRQGYHHVQYNPYVSAHDGVHAVGDKVSPGPGDIFLGLDLAANIAPFHHAEFSRWKRRGVQIHFMVYDLLPVLHPHWFNPKTKHNIRHWLETISVFADGFICISGVVKNDLFRWLEKQFGITPGEIPAAILPLGCDIECSAPSCGITPAHSRLLEKLGSAQSLLMVGTLEPRKGHAQVIAALEQLWLNNQEIRLIIVGKPGWKTDDLQKYLAHHPEKDSRLFWLDDASDEMVQMLYKKCRGVVIASEAEGFGLPLLEASYFSKPVLARDIPAFREISGDNVTFFSGKSADVLAHDIVSWLDQTADYTALPCKIRHSSWHTSGTYLKNYLQDFLFEKQSNT